MINLRTILWVAAGLAVFILACGQDASSTVEPSIVPQGDSTVSPTDSPVAAATVKPPEEAAVYELVSTWGDGPASGVGFISPNGIAIDASDNVYVTEFRGNRVQKFDSEGLLLIAWGSAGIANGQFQSQTGIAIDGDGNVYVSESGNH
jgi:sugar lactone lactonase YvrE